MRSGNSFCGVVYVRSDVHLVRCRELVDGYKLRMSCFLNVTTLCRAVHGRRRSSNDSAMLGEINDDAEARIAKSSRRDADTVIADIKYRQMVRKERLPAIDAWRARNGG